MARRKIKSSKVEEPNRISKRDVDSRFLITFGPDHEIWKGNPSGTVWHVSKSIIRLIPPMDATDVQIENEKATIEAAGAVAVKILPRGGVGAVLSEEDSEGEREPISVDLRAAVIEVARRMPSKNKEALFAELNLVMDKVGL